MPPINSKRYILNVVDFATRYIVPAAVSSTSTGDVIKHLHNVFYTYGTPDHCLSDHGSAFESNEFKRFMSLNSVELHFTIAYRPEGNGLVERSNGTLLAALRKTCAMEPLSWPTKLQEAAFAVNTSMNASTNFAPFQLLYGYVPKIPLQQHRPFQHSALAERILDTTVQRSEAAANSEAAQAARKERYDRSHLSPVIEQQPVVNAETTPASAANVVASTEQQQPQRPQRTRCLPSHVDDFVLE
ncbi:uncharacterized protein LOC125943351 [Dermacentor silvarum]|uniref:uncharacterized protein LOC125943351 n=1 Tax=Dermacentor silvarum TaxID=543639 RepID=UPI002101C825|nr:uncharacterized protein LOC125943351 [Dermacentor silvarum]